MTEPKYKVGDRVLITLKVYDIEEKQHSDGSFEPYYTFTCLEGTLPEQFIYSHAPEFQIGEQIEVSDNGQEWYQDYFLFKSDKMNSGNYRYYTRNLPHPEPQGYRFARRIVKEEPEVLIVNGKKYSCGGRMNKWQPVISNDMPISLESQPGWSTIDSAPKDGTLILALVTNYSMGGLRPILLRWSSTKPFSSDFGWLCPDDGRDEITKWEPSYWCPIREFPDDTNYFDCTQEKP